MSKALSYVLLVCLLCVPFINTRAQRVITGMIKDAETGETLPYATIHHSAGYSTLSNAEGKFSLPIKEEGDVHIRYIGYQAQTLHSRKVPNVIYLKAMSQSMGQVEVLGVDVKQLVKEVIDDIKASYKEWKKERDLYFYRTVFTDGVQTELLEAFVKANSAVNLRDISVVSGVIGWDTTDEDHSIGIRNTNVHRVMQLAPRTFDSTRWKSCVKPFNNLRSALFYYDITLDILEDDEERIIKLSFRRKQARLSLEDKPLMVGTAYIRAKDKKLLRFEGDMDNLFMRSGLSRAPEMLHYTINYDYAKDFARVHSLVVVGGGKFVPNILSKIETLYYRSIILRMDSDTSDKLKEYPITNDILAVIQDANYSPALWEKYDVVKRTDIEDYIVNRHLDP